MTKSIVLFGGSFDPPHFGHLEAIRNLFKNPGAKKIIIVPSASTPLKHTPTSFENRFEMCKLLQQEICLTETLPIEVNDLEQKEKFKFTWQLLEYFRGEASTSKTFVIGTDQFVQLEQWARFPDVMGLCDWVILLRKPHRLSDFSTVIEKYCKQGWLKASSGDSRAFQISIAGKTSTLTFVDTPARDLSSTEIRKKFALGQTVSTSEIPKSILEFIERNQLYGTTRNHDHRSQ